MPQDLNSQMAKKFFPDLDGLRFWAFFFVFLSHSLRPWSKTFNFYSTIFFRPLHLLVQDGGNIGVSIFFVLSGFLITYLITAEKREKGKINIWFFYLRRILRIWPLYYILLLFALVIYPQLSAYFGYPILQNGTLYYLLFLSNFYSIKYYNIAVGNVHYLIRGVTWSVSIEEQFYLIWPLLFIIVPQKLYKYMFLIVILISSVFRYVYRNDLPVIYFHPISFFGDLAMGALAGYYACTNKQFVNFFTNLKKYQIVVTYIIGIACMLFTNETKISLFVSIFSRVINTGFFSFVILEQSFSENSFYKLRNFRFASWWGKYTYGLYLLHPVAITFAIFILSRLGFNYHTLVNCLIITSISFILSLALAYCSYTYLEQPFLRLKKYVYNEG